MVKPHSSTTAAYAAWLARLQACIERFYPHTVVEKLVYDSDPGVWLEWKQALKAFLTHCKASPNMPTSMLRLVAAVENFRGALCRAAKSNAEIESFIDALEATERELETGAWTWFDIFGLQPNPLDIGVPDLQRFSLNDDSLRVPTLVNRATRATNAHFFEEWLDHLDCNMNVFIDLLKLCRLDQSKVVEAHPDGQVASGSFLSRWETFKAGSMPSSTTERKHFTQFRELYQETFISCMHSVEKCENAPWKEITQLGTEIEASLMVGALMWFGCTVRPEGKHSASFIKSVDALQARLQ